MFRQRVDWRAAWLAGLFDHAPCSDCGHGAAAHEAVNVNGQPFARCLLRDGRSTLESAERAWARGDGQ